MKAGGGIRSEEGSERPSAERKGCELCRAEFATRIELPPIKTSFDQQKMKIKSIAAQGGKRANMQEGDILA